MYMRCATLKVYCIERFVPPRQIFDCFAQYFDIASDTSVGNLNAPPEANDSDRTDDASDRSLQLFKPKARPFTGGMKPTRWEPDHRSEAGRDSAPNR